MAESAKGRRARARASSMLAISLLIPMYVQGGTKQPLETLHEFDEATDGTGPGLLTEGPDGRFYGTATFGGQLQGGTVFVMDKRGGDVTVLHAFDLNSEGGYPKSRLLLAADGYLYGTVSAGGSHDCGAIFRISTQTGQHEVMRSFAGGNEGCSPSGQLVQGKDGKIYGTTDWGGAALHGTVYRWDPNGKFKTLKSFAGGRADGSTPSGVTFSRDGQLFGTTYVGGHYDYGTVYALDTDGGNYRMTYSFGGGDGTGSRPFGKLALAKDGNLYGYTKSGGVCCGTIFRVSADGSVSLVHALEFFGELGFPVSGDIALGPDGLMYIATSTQGDQGGGAIFTMSTTGQAQLLHAFAYGESPSEPYGGLTRANGYMYGTGAKGGAGTVFRLQKR